MLASTTQTVWRDFQRHMEEDLRRIETSRQPGRTLLLVSDDEDIAYAAAVVLEVIFQRRRHPDPRYIRYRFDKNCREVALERMITLARNNSLARARFLNHLLFEILGDTPLPRIPMWAEVVSYVTYLARRRPYDEDMPSSDVRQMAQRLLVILLAKATTEGRSAASKGLSRQVLAIIGRAITEEAGVHPPAPLQSEPRSPFTR